MDGLSAEPEPAQREPWAEEPRWLVGTHRPASLRLGEFAGWVGALGVHGPEHWRGWRPPRMESYNSLTGDVNQVRGLDGERVVGVGSGDAWGDREHAAHVAICEGLERYAGSVFDASALRRARATDLGSAALDLDEVATFSDREIAESRGFLGRPEKDAEIRWVEGVDLHTGAGAMVPAVMTYGLTERPPAERFWLPFSTGTAIHETPVKALLAALCEVMERDACAITWLQRLPIPVLSEACLNEEAREILDWFGNRGVETYLFDATTDFGIPVVWCTQFAPYGRHTAQTTATACGLDQRNAALKAILECSRFIPAIESTEPGDDYRKFHDINCGAAYVGMRARRSAFDFLVSGYAERERAAPRVETDQDPRDGLRTVLSRLSQRGYSAYAVDLTTREVAQAGLSCVRVIVPRAQPMSVWPQSQYRGSARLYEAPRLMNHRVLPEAELNPYPVPVT